MTDDDGNQDTPPEGEETVSLAKIEEVVRKVLGEIMPGDPDPDLGLDDDDPADKAVYSVRQAEQIAERAVASAMKKLGAKTPAPKKAAPKPDDDGEPKAKAKPKEPAPTPPEPTVPAYRSKLRKLLVGADD